MLAADHVCAFPCFEEKKTSSIFRWPATIFLQPASSVNQLPRSASGNCCTRPDLGGQTMLNVLLLRESGSRSPSTAQTDRLDRKSTRLNSSHVSISYAVFCLKK